MGSNTVTGVLVRRENRDIDKHRENAGEDGGRDWSHAAASQGRPKLTDNQQKLEEARKDSPLEHLEVAWPCSHLDFRLLASRAVRE